MSELTFQTLLTTSTVEIRDVCCWGWCRQRSAEEHVEGAQLVFPYRGVYVRHVDRGEAVAEANQVVFFNRGEGYRVSHPVAGGDASLSLGAAARCWSTNWRRARCCGAGRRSSNRQQRLRIDPRAQALVAMLRHSLARGHGRPAGSGEAGADAGAARARSADQARGRWQRRGGEKLADRVKLVLAGDLARRWTLAEIAAEVGDSPVYLTQVFQQVEGAPLYRYQLRLRLARALDRGGARLRRPDGAGPRPRLRQPQPLHRRLPPRLRPVAIVVQAGRAPPVMGLGPDSTHLSMCCRSGSRGGLGVDRGAAEHAGGRVALQGRRPGLTQTSSRIPADQHPAGVVTPRRRFPHRVGRLGDRRRAGPGARARGS